MYELALNDSIIEKVKLKSVSLLKKALQSDLVEIILYGSCAGGTIQRTQILILRLF